MNSVSQRMNINADVLGVLGTHLSPNTLEALRTVSKDIATGVQESKKTAIFWKHRAEYLAGGQLPFLPRKDKLEYWKSLANKLQQAVDRGDVTFKQLFKTGEYEFVYIGIMNGVAGYTEGKHAISHAIARDDERSVLLLMKIFPIYFLYNMYHMNHAILIRKHRILKLLLDNSTRDQVIMHDKSPLILTAMAGNEVALEMILHKYPLKHYECESLLKNIRVADHDRVALLGVFIKECPGKYGNISDYIRHDVSGDEMSLLLSSNMFNVDVVRRVEILSPEAAHMLYTLDHDMTDEYKLNLLRQIVPNPTLFESALEYDKPLQTHNLWRRVLKVPTTSWLVMTNHFQTDKNLVIEVVCSILNHSFAPQAVIGVCNHVNITIQDIEVMIAECDERFVGTSVRNIIALGIPLRHSPTSRWFLGEKLAFNCDLDGLQALHDAGFNFNICGTDLIKHCLRDNTTSILKLLDYVTQYDVDAVHATLSWYFRGERRQDTRLKVNAQILGYYGNHETYGIVSHFRDAVESNNTNEAIKELKRLIPWSSIFYNYDYTWLSMVSPELAQHPLMKEGIAIMKFDIENKILRDDIRDENDFIAWLRLARGLLSSVHMGGGMMNFLFPSVIIDGGVVRFNRSIYSGKYKSLDLFSSEGALLTTKDDVRVRRRELQEMNYR